MRQTFPAGLDLMIQTRRDFGRQAGAETFPEATKVDSMSKKVVCISGFA